MSPRRPRSALGLSLALAAMLFGCRPQLEPIRWQPLDIEALREAVAHPTGFVDEAAANEVAYAVVAGHESYRALSGFLHQVFAEPEPGASGDTGPVWVVPQALSGTSVYLLVACPGPDLDPGQPFAHGSLRIDSPSLDADVVATWAIEGQVRLGFDGCRIGDLVFDGSGPFYHASEPFELGFAPTLEVVDLAAPELPPIEIAEPLLWDPLDQVSAVFELESGETLVLDWRATDLELLLRGVNGALTCTIVDAELVCEPP